MAFVTVAIVFRNEKQNLPQLLNSVDRERPHHLDSHFHFLLIDNASTDSSVQIVEDWKSQTPWSHVKFISREENHMAEARQQALEEAMTPWVAFVDADSILIPNWFEKVVQILQSKKPQVAVIGSENRFVAAYGWQEFALGLVKYFPLRKSDKSFVDHVPTNNCLISREKALSVGGFCPFYKYVGEDLDLSVRIRRKYFILYDSGFPVIHKLPDSVMDWYRKMAFYGRAQSFVFFKNRQGLPLLKFIPAGIVFLLVAALLIQPILTLSLLVLLLLIPRLRFISLSFLFYGFGEWVGAGLLLSSKLRFADKSRQPEELWRSKLAKASFFPNDAGKM